MFWRSCHNKAVALPIPTTTGVLLSHFGGGTDQVRPTTPIQALVYVLTMSPSLPRDIGEGGGGGVGAVFSVPSWGRESDRYDAINKKLSKKG